MYYTLFFIISLLNFGSLKTETVDFSRKNNRIDIFPLDQEKENDIALFSPDIESNNEDWNDNELKYQLNNYRKYLNFNDDEKYKSDEMDFPEDQFKSIDQLDDIELSQFSKYLIKLLQRPDLWEAPFVLVKDSEENLEDRNFPLDLNGFQNIAKRSRYYRRYPWKRQNSRSYSMDSDPYNACNPTRNDVFQLLVALHDARQGNKSRIVNFCNRRRPASAVYTNIRFLGRRKK